MFSRSQCEGVGVAAGTEITNAAQVSQGLSHGEVTQGHADTACSRG